MTEGKLVHISTRDGVIRLEVARRVLTLRTDRKTADVMSNHIGKRIRINLGPDGNLSSWQIQPEPTPIQFTETPDDVPGQLPLEEAI